MTHLQVQICLESVTAKLKLSRAEVIEILLKNVNPNLKSILKDLRVEYIGYIGNFYDIIKVIGEGTYGSVLKVQDQETKKLYALKLLSNQAKTTSFLEEAAILADLSNYKECNRYIVCVYDIFNAYYKNKIRTFVKMELIEGHELFYLLNLMYKKNISLPYDLIRLILYSVLKALSYIHGRGVAHRDIKPENIMFNSKYIKLIDFGFGCTNKKIRSTCSQILGTQMYAAPEIFRTYSSFTNNYVKLDYIKFDMWALGVMILAFINVEYFEDRYEEDFNKHIMETKGSFMKYIPHIRDKIDAPDIKYILENLLQFNPTKRISAKEALKLINKDKIGTVKELNEFYNSCHKISKLSD